jgi:hypothetical protein
MSVASYTASNGLPGELVDAGTLLAAVSSGTTGNLVTDALTAGLHTPPTNEGNAFQSTSASVNIQVRNETWTATIPAWYMVYVDLRSVNILATDTLTLSVQSTSNAITKSANSYQYTLQIAPSTIPTGSYTTVSGLFPMYITTPNIFLQGTVTNGLFVARIRLEVQPTAPHLLGCQANQLLYNTTQTNGYITVNVSNVTGTTQTATFTVTLQSEFDTSTVVYNQSVSIANPATPETPVVIQIPLPAMPESGYSVSVNMQWTSGSVSVNETATDYFYVSNYPARFGHTGSLGLNSVYENIDNSTIAGFRSSYIQLVELDFGAPSDVIYQSWQPPAPSPNPPPNADQYWSGQDLYRMSVGKIADICQYIISLGMVPGAYCNLLYDFGGPFNKEFFRQFPHWCNWYESTGKQNIDVAAQDQQERESDAERFNANGSTNFGPSGIWSPACGDPTFLAWYCSQIQRGMMTYGFGWIRNDDQYTYDYPWVNVMGNNIPYPGFQNPQILATIQASMWAVNPFAFRGQNAEMWQMDFGATVAMPITNPSFTGDYYTEMMYGDGMHLQERWSKIIGGQPWALIQSNFFQIGYNAWRFGGNAHVITGLSGFATIDAKVMLVLLLVSQCHSYGNTQSFLFCYMQMAVRYSRLLWGKNCVNLYASGANPLAVSSANNLWWQNYVYSLQITASRTIYFVHLVNQPTNSNAFESTLQSPATAALTWTLPGVTATAAWAITADGNTATERGVALGIVNLYTTSITDAIGIAATETSVPFTQAGDVVSMTVSNVILWTMVVLDCEV